MRQAAPITAFSESWNLARMPQIARAATCQGAAGAEEGLLARSSIPLTGALCDARRSRAQTVAARPQGMADGEIDGERRYGHLISQPRFGRIRGRRGP